MQGTEPQLVLPSVNRYLRRLQHEYLDRDPLGQAGFYTEVRQRIGRAVMMGMARQTYDLSKMWAGTLHCANHFADTHIMFETSKSICSGLDEASSFLSFRTLLMVMTR